MNSKGKETTNNFKNESKIQSELNALRKSESRLRLIWENSIDGFRITDKDGIIMDVNDSFCRMMRKEKNELIGQRLDVVYSPKSDDNPLKVYLDRISRKSVIPREDFKLRLWDERKLWFSVSTITIDDEDRKLWISVFRDITEAKKTELLHKVIYEISTAVFDIRDLETLLSKMREIFSQIVNTTNFLVALYNKETEMLSIPFQSSTKEHFLETPMAGTFSGYVIKTNESLLMNKEESFKMVADGNANMVGEPAEIWMGVPIRVNGEVFGVIVIQDYEDENAFGVEELNLLEFASDQIGAAIERIRSREELEKSEQALRISNDTKDRFFSIIAHDLKNPFLTLKGFLEILFEDYDELSEKEIKENLSMLIKVSEKTFGLLTDLLLWSRAQRGKIELKIEELDVAKLMNEAAEPLVESAEKKGVKLIVDINEKYKVVCDSFTTKTVIRNLISNAIKFSNAGDCIYVKCESLEDKMNLVVEDTGVGMDEKTLTDLFKLDKNVTGKGTAGEEGTGLGLMLCKDFVERNNGMIKVESEKNKGTKVSFNLPRAD